jgi:SpoVK/Ycf46/Vps4 family AAA+-type ATPase
MPSGIEDLEGYAVRAANEAVKYDKQGLKTKAIERYDEAIRLLMKLAEFVESPEIRTIYLEKAQKYRRRVEALKSNVDVAYAAGSGQDAVFDDLVVKERVSVSWDEVIGLDDVKQAIKESIIYPLRKPELFPLGWAKGILLFGPPGCGKSLLAAAVSKEIDAEFYLVRIPELISKYLGESEKRVERLFAKAREIARNGRPVILFFDEVDSVMGVRDSEVGGEVRARNQLLTEMDGVLTKGFDKMYLYVMAATNKPWVLDEPFIRRFGRRIYVRPPSFEERLKLLELYTAKLKLDSNVSLSELAFMTEGHSSQDIKDICVDAHNRTVREFFELRGGIGEPRPITKADFIAVLEYRKPSISLEMLAMYEDWSKKWGSTVSSLY